jgi:uncharacterized protein
VIVLDANLLLYAYDSTSSQHTAARRWIEEIFTAKEPVGIPWQTVSAFLRIATNTVLKGQRFTIEEAVELVDRWRERPNVHFLSTDKNHWDVFQQMLRGGQVRGPLVSDAQLAAIAVEHGGILYTTDRDFSRFPGLRWKNPLQG